MSLDRTVLDPQAVIVGAVEVSTVPATVRGIKLAVDVAPACPLVLGDVARLQQVVSNLLTNAIKHSEPGRTVSVVLDWNTTEARLKVEDEGCGIAPELLHTSSSRIVKLVAISPARVSSLA